MKNTFKNKLYALLKKDSRLWDKEKKEINETLLKDLIDRLDEKLVELLLGDKEAKEKFFIKIKDVFVLRANDLKFFIDENKLDNSYTQYQNKIGLRIGNKLLNERDEVVLDWPFKDCVLEGGMTKEDEKRNEIFFNEVLAKDEIDRLEDPKALVNWNRYTAKGEEKVKEIKRDKDGIIRENLIIKGNNLLALHSLKEQFTGKVKLIYIDPPYNTGSDSFAYNDNFNHSTWLTFMRNRLKVAKELLKNSGVIFVQCDDSEQAYLKVLLDEVFNRENYLNTITIKTKASSGASGGGEDKRIKKNTEYLLVYQASDEFDGFNDIFSDKPLKDYIDERKELSKNFAYKTVFVDPIKKTFLKTIKSGRGDDIKLYKINNPQFASISKIAKEGKCNEYQVYEKYFEKIFTLENAQTSIRGRVLEAVGTDDNYYIAEYIPVSGKNKGKLTEVIFGGKTKRLLSWLKNVAYKDDKGELIKRDKVGTLWDDLSWSSVSVEGGVSLENGKKPEALIERIINMTTSREEIVLDYHAGSGTTLAVAHKTGRQYIGIEQLDYEGNDPETRLKNVVKGDQSGISESVDWQGGGNFVYLELAKWNEEAKDKILKAKNLSELAKLFDELYERYFLNYNVKTKEFKEKTIKEEEFKKLGLDKQKRLFVEMLDMNQMYVNFSERADKKYNLSKEDITLSEEYFNAKK